MRYIPKLGRKQPAQFFFDLLVDQPLGPLLGHDDQVNGRQMPAVAAKKFPEQALDAIPLHRFSQALGHDQTQPGTGRDRWRQGHAEMARIQPFTLGLGPKEVSATAEAL
jgi:hypothetical protein